MADLKSAVDNKARGEKVEKPLLIGDFLKSSINQTYFEQEEEVRLGENTKLVQENRAKKTRIQDYTPQIWAAANYRIILYLLKNGTSADTMRRYVTYSAMICDYLSKYQHSGVFVLDYEHRHRVALEGRLWDDIWLHDNNTHLNVLLKKPGVSETNSSSSAVVKPKKARKFGSKRKVDASGKQICLNYNTKAGCSYRLQI